MKSWYWEMERAGWGPHYYLSLEFAPENAIALREQLFVSLPDGFRLQMERDEETPSGSGLPLSSKALMWGREDNSEWNFAFVILNEATLELESSWGPQGEEVSAVLGQLANNPQLRLRKWRASAGGEGYNPQYGRSGNSAQTLLAYLMGEVAEPNWAHIEQSLGRALADSNPCQNAMSECLLANDGETLRAVLLYDVPPNGNGREWDCFPTWEELIAIARAVGEQHGIPYSASSASDSTPADNSKVIGGSMTFGIASHN